MRYPNTVRILFNALVATGRKTGIGYYANELIRSLREEASDIELDLFPPAWLRWLWGSSARLRPLLERGKRASATPSSNPSGGLLSKLRGLNHAVLRQQMRWQCWGRDYALYHEPNVIPLPSGLPTVITVHDLSLLHPQWHPADRVRYFEQHFPLALQQCAHVITGSEFSRRELLKTFGLPPQRVTRAYYGMRRDLAPLPSELVQQRLRALGLPPQYLLYLGTLEPRKNIQTLLQAYCALPTSLQERWPLLLVGGWGWNTAALRADLERLAKAHPIRHLGYLPDEDLGTLYNGARALVYPSYYEGFGLPPAEMMACGGAVLASTAEAIVEAVGARAHLLAPEDTDGWRDALARVLTDDAWWQSLRAGTVAVAQRYTWAQCARITAQVYRQVAGTALARAA